MLSLTVFTVAVTLSAVLPPLLQGLFYVAPAFVTELLTKANAGQAVKSGVALVLAACSAAAAQVVFEPGWTWQQYLATFGYTVLATVVAHKVGVTRPLQTATARFGLGQRDVIDPPGMAVDPRNHEG